jgi:drug/metabolite transporter (DMT)-like permease
MIYAYFISIAWGISYYLASRLTKIGISYSTFTLFLFPLSFGIIIYGIYNNDFKDNLKLIDSSNITLILFYVIFNLLGNVLVFMAMKTVDPFTVSILELAYPIVIFLIMFILNEIELNLNHVIGIFFTFFGIFLILKESSR